VTGRRNTLIVPLSQIGHDRSQSWVVRSVIRLDGLLCELRLHTSQLILTRLG
jgi:hypothetical protein